MKLPGYILLCVKNEVILSSLQAILGSGGYKPIYAASLKEVNNLVQRHMLLLAIVEVDADSDFKLCAGLRKRVIQLPVIYLAYNDRPEQKLAALKAGADDYIVTPFNNEELLLKINRLIERSTPLASLMPVGKGWLDVNIRHAKCVNGASVALSKIEFELLCLFIEKEGEVLSRSYIYNQLWGYHETSLPNTRTLDNFMVCLRKYFEENPRKPRHFLAVRGVGYKFRR